MKDIYILKGPKANSLEIYYEKEEETNKPKIPSPS